MATSTTLIDGASDVLQILRSHANNTFKELRAAELVSNEGRGRNAAQMSANDAATFLIGLAAAEHVKHAKEAVWRYARLPLLSSTIPHDIASRFHSLTAAHNFLEALTSLLDEYITSDPSVRVRVAVRGPLPQADIYVAAERIRYGISQPVPTTPTSSLARFARGLDDAKSDSVIARVARETDTQPERQRNKFISAHGDATEIFEFTDRTLSALGKLLRS